MINCRILRTHSSKWQINVKGWYDNYWWSYKFVMAVVSIPEVENLPQTVDVVAQGTQQPYARRTMVIIACRAKDKLLFVCAVKEMLCRQVNGWNISEI